MAGSDTAERLATFLDGQQVAWERHLETFGNAHWHIISFVRSHGEDGVSVRRIFAFLSGVFGMDMVTCVKRLRELSERDLLSSEADRMSRGTLIFPSPRLLSCYDAYCVDVANLMVKLVFEDAAGPVVNGVGCAELSDTLHHFFTSFAEQSQPAFDRYIRRTIPQPARRERAGKSLPTFGYWQTTFLCWKERSAERLYVYADDIHVALYPVLKKSPDATRQIVSDLIDWGFLVRLSRADGVPNNRFAVRLSDEAFELYRIMFERGYELLVSTSQEVLRSLPTSGSDAGTVVPIKRRSPRSLAGSTPLGESADAG